uniref:Mu transposase domain-containing protein n=1 Tax=Siminovitchia sp. FSL H7-0308 TaxID=2921432 RepID=UPI00403F7279
MPVKEYKCVKYGTLKADKYGYVKVDLNLHSTSPRYALNKVLVKISYNKVDVLNDENQVIVNHSRLYGQYRKSMKWQPYLNLMAKRPTALK